MRRLKYVRYSFVMGLPQIVCLVLACLVTGCGFNEPDKQTIQGDFQRNSSAYEELLKVYREDRIETNVSFVSAESPSRTQCGLKPNRHNCTLRAGRWEEYRHRLQQLGVLWIEYDEPSDRFYFVTYYEPFLMNARLLGVVFSEEKTPKVSAYYPKQQWWPIQNGWYSFLMIDAN